MLTSEEAGLYAASLRDLRSTTDLALRTTKAAAQDLGRSMSSLIMLERHLWLTMTEMKEADKVPFLDAPVLSSSLFGPAVESLAERFTEAQKLSQAMRCDTSRNAPALLLLLVAPNLRRLNKQPNQRRKPLSLDLKEVDRIEGAHAQRDATPSWSAKDHGPKLPWIQCLRSPPDQSDRERKDSSLVIARPPCKQPLMCLLSPRSALGAEENVFLVPHGPTLAPGCPTGVIADKLKHIHFQKRANVLLSLPKASCPYTASF